MNTSPVNRHDPVQSAEPRLRHWRWDAPAPSAQQALPEHARWMHRLAQLPPGRADQTARVRSEILAGTYETMHKLDVAVERLARDLA
jgi:hypothetical protein